MPEVGPPTKISCPQCSTAVVDAEHEGVGALDGLLIVGPVNMIIKLPIRNLSNVGNRPAPIVGYVIHYVGCPKLAYWHGRGREIL